ncbi:RHS repeat-associated core domain-containing protein [Flavobacterium sp. H122]|uniref:RHS repeat-associated core domain-containing protein n=1 Tax=Flavobacterium sp. H122 TaxID=2529860 RepID=UPI0010AA6E61|nr:FG-GAP-like repeat-containing protein [Flavobacterium sp. H122]
MKKIILFTTFLFSITTFSQSDKQNKVNTGQQTLREEPIDPNDPYDPLDPVDPVDPPLPTEVGKTRGELSVSLTGAANYTVPIQVPPGINGIEPKLSLSYNSQGGVGLAGYGWNVSGLSSITRIPATKFHDGFNDPVDLDSNDRFALDGQRLILETGTYGEAGATYVTENHSNVKIMTFPISGNPTRFYFKVLYPDGSYAIYDAENGGYNTNYKINTWVNPQGLKINYNYTNSNNFLYISSIKYGILDSSASINEVQFIYKTRNNAEQYFQGGYEIIDGKILSEIKILGNNVGYKNYTLTHDIITGYERLTKIQEKSGDGIKLLTPVEFVYGSDNQITMQFLNKKDIVSGGEAMVTARKFQPVLGDFDGNGELDMIIKSNSDTITNQTIIRNSDLFLNFDETSAGYIQGTRTSTPHIVNGDAILDTFTFDGLDYNTSGNKIANKQGWCDIERVGVDILFKIYSKSSTDVIQLNETKKLENFDGQKTNFLKGDFNGDGLLDVVAFTGERQLTDKIKFYFVNLDKRATVDYTQYLGEVKYYDNYSYKKNLVVHTGDINGDGKTDIILYIENDVNSYVAVYNLNDTNTGLNEIINFKYKFDLYSDNAKKSIHEGDFNGDGKTDILFTSTARVILYSTGSSFKVETIPSDIPTEDENNTIFIYDINNDKKSDFLSITKNRIYSSSETVYSTLYVKQDGTLCDPQKEVDCYQITKAFKRDTYKIDLVVKSFVKNGVLGINSTVWKSNTLNFSTGSFETNASPIYVYQPFFIKTNKSFTKNILSIADYNANKLLFFDISSINDNKLLKKIKNNNNEEYITYNNIDYNSHYSNASQLENYPNYDILVSKKFKIVTKIIQADNTNYKVQDFKYYGATTNFEGQGFLGFRSILRTNWYNDTSQIISNITKFDINKRGAQTDSFSVLGLASPTLTLNSGTSFINRTQTIYNNEDTVFENPLLVNKVFKLKPTKIIQTNGLEGTSVEKTLTYNTNNSPTQITTTYKNGGVTEKTATQTLNYDSITTPYMVDRLTQKNYTATVYPSGDTTSSEEVYTYNTNLLTQIKKKGDGTDYLTEDNQYDAFGNITRKTLSATNMTSRVSSFEYDLSGRFITKKTDIEGLITNYTYDLNKGLLLTESFPSVTSSSLKNTYTYDTWGKLISKSNIYGKKENYTYANTYEGGFTKKITNEEGGYLKVTYDAVGREIQTENKDLNGNSTFVDKGYDFNNRLTTVTQPNNGNQNVWNETQYDIYGRVIQTISLKSGSSPGKVTTYSYSGTTVSENDGVKPKTTTRNSLDQTVSLTEAPGGTINYSYFANGNLKSTVCNGATITIVQDGWGRKKELIDPSAGNRKYDYNAFGELIKEEVAGQGETIYELNSVGKLISKTINDAGGNLFSKSTYTYNANKLVESIRLDDYTNNSFTTNNFTYDAYYNILSTTEELNGKAKFSKTITYDAFGRPSTETYTSQNISNNKSSSRTITNVYKNGYKWKNLDNSTGLPIWETKTVNPQGQILTASLGNGVAINNTYDIYGFPTQNKHDKSTTNIMTLTNTFDPIRGNLLTRSNNMFGAWNETLSYDLADRLTTYKNAQGVQTQNYNNNGTIASNNIGDYAYTFSGKPHQVSSVTPVDQTSTSPVLSYFDPKIQNVTYTVFKSPISIKVESKEYIDFEYNTYNNRSVMYYGSLDADKQSRPYRKYYAADGTMEIKLKTTSPASLEFITYLGGDAYSAPALLKSDGTTQKMYYLHRDYQGTIVGITDDLGTMVEKRLFDVWGEMINYQNGAVTTIPSTTGTMFIDRGYTGHEHLLGVDIINMNGRIYDHKFHRFLQPDNNIQDPANTQNYNRYAYVMNNPTKYTDPSGEIWGWVVGFLVSTYIHGAQATGNANPLEWNAGQWAGAVSSAAGPTVFNYVSTTATDAVNGYIMNYDQPTAAQMEYMNNNPVENHSYVNTSVNWENESSFDMASSGTNDPFDFREYQIQKKDLLDFNFKLIDRFKNSGLDPDIEAPHNTKEQAQLHAMKIVYSVKGLNDFYKSVGSPNFEFLGRSSSQKRGETPGIKTIYLYNGAFISNYWLASTIFHELTHVYQNLHMGISTTEAERMAYSVEWRLGNRDEGIKKMIKLNQ